MTGKGPAGFRRADVIAAGMIVASILASIEAE